MKQLNKKQNNGDGTIRVQRYGKRELNGKTIKNKQTECTYD